MNSDKQKTIVLTTGEYDDYRIVGTYLVPHDWTWRDALYRLRERHPEAFRALSDEIPDDHFVFQRGVMRVLLDSWLSYRGQALLVKYLKTEEGFVDAGLEIIDVDDELPE